MDGKENPLIEHDYNEDDDDDDEDDETTSRNPKTSTPVPSGEKIGMKTFGKGKGPKTAKTIAETTFIEGGGGVVEANKKPWDTLIESLNFLMQKIQNLMHFMKKISYM